MNRSADNSEIRLCAIMKDEEPYIVEWVAYYRSQGIEDLVIGDNGGTDGTSELLIKLDKLHFIKRVNLIDKAEAQIEFYQEIISQTPSTKIVGFIDADEFVYPLDPCDNISDIIVELFRDFDAAALSINWAVYGSSGQINQAEDLVIERFTNRAPREFAANKHVKTFVRVSQFLHFSGNPHAVVTKSGRCVDSSGAFATWLPGKMGLMTDPVWGRLRINHYVIKSYQEWLEKKARRGSAISAKNASIKANENYFKGYDRNEVFDPMKKSTVSRTKSEIVKIKTIL